MPISINVLRMSQLTRKVGKSRSTIYEALDPRSPRYDPTFPKPLYLSARSVGWVESEVDNWLRARLLARDGPHDTGDF